MYDLKPDMMTTAKALTSGYFPYSASFVSEEIWELVKEGSVKYGNFAHGYTYAGHPIGAAVAMANLDIIEREHLVDNAAAVGAYFQEQLKNRFSHDCFVAQVRGEGMIAAVQLVKDKADKTFFDKEVKNLCQSGSKVLRKRTYLSTIALIGFNGIFATSNLHNRRY